MFKRGDIVRIVGDNAFSGTVGVVVRVEMLDGEERPALTINPIYAPSPFHYDDWIKAYLFDMDVFEFEKLCEVEVEPNEEKEHD